MPTENHVSTDADRTNFESSAAETTEGTATEATGERPSAVSARTPLWSRIVIFGAAGLAILLVGATLGMLFGPAADKAEQTPGAGSVAVGFAQDMSRHHLQAVTMANLAQARSSDPEVQQLAFDIASTQLEQVGRMRGWLMLWDQPENVVGEPMAWMSGMSMPGHSGDHSGASKPPMPGMAIPEEMQRLRSLSGEEFDVYFLQLMLRHHKGGVAMARYAKEHSSVGAVVTLANSMLLTQGAEMDLMKRMLADHGAEPLPYP